MHRAVPKISCITGGVHRRIVLAGLEALEDRPPKPSRVWNRIPDEIRDRIVHMALEDPDLSPRELAVRFTDTQAYFVSEASVYRLLKAHDLITSPAFVVIKAGDEFRDRRLEENANGGTDHGSAAFMFVLGGAVKGGQMYGQWPGLKEQDLRQGDLMVTTDYRQVVQEILIKRRGEKNPERVFPSLNYAPLDFIEAI